MSHTNIPAGLKAQFRPAYIQVDWHNLATYLLAKYQEPNRGCSLLETPDDATYAIPRDPGNADYSESRDAMNTFLKDGCIEAWKLHLLVYQAQEDGHLPKVDVVVYS